MDINNNTAMWPPAVITEENASAIIDECELMELLPERGQGKQFVAVSGVVALVAYASKNIHGADSIFGTPH